MIRKFFMLAVALLTTAISFADGPFRNHRYDAFKVLPVNSEQIVFIGNSITNMHEWWEAFGNHNIVNRGVSGAITDEGLANIEAIAAGKPKKVFIMLGTNDLGTSGINTTEHVLQNVSLIVDRFKQTSPNTEIYVQSILPSASGIRTLEAEQAANVALETMCTEKGATYIDLWEAMQGITNNTLSYDYLHLTSDGYKIWCDIIAPYVMDDENATSVYGTEAQANGGLGGANGMRATVFSKLPVNNDDILIIGDEMINGGEWHELLKSNKIKNRGTTWGYPGPSLADMLKMVDAIFNGGGSPAQVFLYAGVSDVNGSTALETVLASYKSVVTKIQGYSPNTKITLMSLQPTSTAATNTGRVAPFNTLLQQYAAESTTDNIEYLDIYTDFVSNNVANTAYFTGNYLYGKGYVKVAQKIAATINEQGITAITDDEANALYTRFTNRTALGTAIVTAASLPEGDGVGEYTTANLAAVKEKIAAAYAALAASTTASDVFTTEATNLSTATTELLPKINMPATSDANSASWYQLYTPNRENRYLASNGAGEGAIGMTANAYARTMWKFVTREDGKLDIINREDNSYLAPTAAYNNQITTSTEQPENGWELSYSNAAGLFIVHSGTVQLNQTGSGQSYKIYNWSSGNSGTDRADTGCQYKIALYTGDPEVEPVVPTDDNFQNVITDLNSLTEGWYKMRVVTGSDATMQGYITAGNNNILNANTAYRQNASNFYPLKIGAYPTDKPATAWLKVKKIGNKYLIQAISGLGILEPCTATRSLESGNTTLTMSYGGFTTVDKWSYYNPGADTEQPYVGKASSTSHKYAFAPVSASELAAYDIYTVSISGVENATEIGSDPSVTYTGSAAIGGISKVFNNGYFFFPAGTVPVASDFTIPTGLKMTVDTSSKRLIVAVPTELEPIVTVDALTFATYPYELRKSDAAKLFATTDVTIAMEVTMPASFNGRRAFISAGDPTQAAVSTATKDNSPYFAYGHYNANVAYLASSNGGDRFTTNSASLTANTVNKVVIVVDQTNNSYKVYVDGALHQELTFPLANYVLQTFNKLAGNDNAKIYIGGGVTSDNSSFEVFQGKIHTVQFFDKALTTDEIASIEYPASKYFFAANTKQSDGTYIDRYLYVNGSNLANAEGYELDNANYEWSLILNGTDAYYLKNGSGKYLSYASTSLKVADSEYSFQFKNDAVHTGVGAMSLYNPTSTGGKYMVMAATGASFNQTSSAINDGTWCSDYILTSVAKASIGYPALTVAINDANNLLGRTTEGTNPGHFTTASRTALQEAIAAAEVKNATDGLTDDEVTAAVAALEAAIATYEAARCEVQYSTADNPVWYYILSAATNDYCTGKAMKKNASGPLTFSTKQLDPNMVWRFEKGSNGKVAICNYAGGYISKSQEKGNAAAGMTETAAYNYTITAWSGTSLGNKGFTIQSDASSNPLHAQNANSVIVTWAAADNGASLWSFEPLAAEDIASTAQLSSTAVQLGLTATGIGNEKEPLLRIGMTVTGLNGSATLQNIKGTITNSSAVEKLYIYSVADIYEYRKDRTDATLMGEATPAADGSFDIAFTNAQTLPLGNSPYYWLVADISEEATEGTVIDAAITSYTINDGTVLESTGNPANSTTVFLTASTVEYCNTYNSRYYRIPAIATAMNGWLVAVADKRFGSIGDLPNNIDVVARVSKDNGKTWTEPVTIAGTAELGGDYGHGDPAIVTDRITGDIIVLVTSKRGFYSGTPDDPTRLKCIISHDNGLTWDAPVDITDQIYGSGCSDEVRKGWYSMFFSSGAALQTSKGTLMCVAPVATTSNFSHSLFEAQIIRSEDHGKTWTCNAVPALTDADESKIVELNDGRLLVKSRKQGGGDVYYAISDDDGKTWTPRAQFAGVYDPGCNGDIIRLTSTGKDEGANRLLLSVPDATSRKNVTVYLSTDEAETWPVKKSICPGGSAYSTMTVLEDGTIGMYLEEDALEGGYQMRYVRFSLDWLTGGSDEVDSEKFNAARVKEAQTLAGKLPEIAAEVNAGSEGAAIGSYVAKYNATADVENALAQAATSANLQTIQDALTAYMGTYSVQPVLPTGGNFYAISNNGNYIQGATTSDGKIAMNTTNGAAAIFYLDGNHLLSYSNGQYIGLNANDWAFEAVGSDDISEITFVVSANAGECNIKSADRWLHSSDTYVNRCTNNTCGAAHNWAITEVTELPVTIGSVGYSTFYAPVAVAIPDGVTAYRAVINGDYIDLHAFDGTIPAGQAVILQGAANTYNFTITADVEFTGENHLLGTTKKIATSSVSNPYTLQTDATAATGVVMRRYTGENINGFKMYMSISDAQASALSFRFPGTTGIDSFEAEGAGDGRVYDLFGRPVQSPTKGIYVIDGKKVIY